MPRVSVEPQLPSAHEYATVQAVRRAVLSHDDGSFLDGAVLAERMRWNPRVWSVMQTRANGATATKVRWREARPNRDGRRALAAWREDYPRMVTEATRTQRHWHGLFLGLDFGQRAPVWDPSTGRWLLALRPYWPGWATWDDARQVYRIELRDGQWAEVPSPALGGTIDPTVSPWYVYEPHGPHSWRWGLLHPLWFAWFGLENCVRDGFRWSEKHGLAILKFFFPDGSGPEYEASRDLFLSRGRKLGAEGAIPCRRGPNGEADFDVQLLEASGGAGFAGIEGTRNATNVDVSVAVLGHNLTTEVKGGSHAAANVGDLIRSDFKRRDVGGELQHDRDQLGAAWAMVNFGDPSLAPIGEEEPDPPAADQQAAATVAAVAQALAALPPEIRAAVDVEALLDRFKIALTRPVAVAAPAGDDAPDAPTGPVDAPAGEPAPSTKATAESPADGTPDDTAAKMALALTPTDLAAAVRLDEVRRAIGQQAVGGEEGQRWMAEHAARVREAAGLAPEPGASAPPTPQPPGNAPDQPRDAAEQPDDSPERNGAPEEQP